ncbi:MAG: DNA repair exonuclease [Deltaproteobacteria bacterium]|nr:DNA repair exonuclease [Deltaproteobacteria bacterium]
MVRVIHTADWQMGMRAVHAGSAAERVRAERLDAAERLASMVRARGADFVLVCGDTFEDHHVDRALVSRVVEILASCRCPVYIISGNHDPMVPGSVWSDASFRTAPTVHVLREQAPVEAPCGVVLWPCVATARHDENDPTRWIVAPQDGRLHVGLAHGTVESVHREEPWYPIARDAAERAGLHYLALGHFHLPVLYPDSAGRVRMAYSGTHEPTRFGEKGGGTALLVTFDSPDKSPEIEQLQTGRLRWVQVERTLRERTELPALFAELAALEGKDTTLLRVRLEGVFALDEQESLESLAELVRGQFLYGRVESHLRPAPTDARWTETLPVGPTRDAALKLSRWADPECTDRPAEIQADVAARALLELYVMAAETDPS